MKRSGLGGSPLFIKIAKPNKPPSNTETHMAVPKKKENKDIYTVELVDRIRRNVRENGKEATTHRLSVRERKSLLEIVYHYKLQGIRTNENEIARISLNFLIQDYKERKQHSLLARVIAALND